MFLRRKKLSIPQQVKKFAAPDKGYQQGYKRLIAYFAWRIKRLPGTPEFIAKGFSIGVAINFWPLLFTHLFFGYILCRVFKGSLIAMFIGTLFGNPWTFAIVYPLMYKLGKIMLGLRPRHAAHAIDSAGEVWSMIWPVESWHNLAVAFQEFFLPMMIGGFLLGLPCALFAYYLARNGISVYQSQRRKILLKRFEAVEREIEQPQPPAQ